MWHAFRAANRWPLRLKARLCSTEVMPILAPSHLGSAAMVSVAPADALNRMSQMTALLV
jgi:hypothetical protein